MAKEQTAVRDRTRTNLREPRRYKVIIYNDDFTTMEFVVLVLTSVFFKSAEEAEALMLAVHKSGSAVVGIYSYDMAISKVRKATMMAREENFPLRLGHHLHREEPLLELGDEPRGIVRQPLAGTRELVL